MTTKDYCPIVPPDYTSVEVVNLNKYMGRWYEISSYPQWFEKGLTDVSALYTPKNGYVEVINSGKKNGKYKQVKGRAKAIKGYCNSRLKVSFWRPFYGSYWIVDLSEDYSWSVVSNSKRTTLWILSREKTMDEKLYRSIVDRLSMNGYDISKLQPMKHCG